MILAALKAKVAGLQEELKVLEKASSAEVFETDDPQYNQHVVSHIYVSKYNTGAHNVYQFNLRAILFHDGAMIGQKHLYMYVRGEDDRWWKIQEHEATEVSDGVFL